MGCTESSEKIEMLADKVEELTSDNMAKAEVIDTLETEKKTLAAEVEALKRINDQCYATRATMRDEINALKAALEKSGPKLGELHIVVRITKQDFQVYNKNTSCDDMRLHHYAEKVMGFIRADIEDENAKMCSGIWIQQALKEKE